MITLELETAEFNKALIEFIKKSDLSTDVIIRKTALDLLANILRPEPYGRHPVDTGRARSGWYMAAQGLGMSFSDQGNNPAAITEGKASGGFAEHLKGYLEKYVELVNAVDYILFLEYGYSQAAPAGMVRISMRKMTGKMPEALTAEFLKDWNQVGL